MARSDLGISSSSVRSSVRKKIGWRVKASGITGLAHLCVFARRKAAFFNGGYIMNKAMEMIERVRAGEGAEDVIAGRDTGGRTRKTALRA